jgi:hypothetical protein
MLAMVAYSRRPQSGHITCYFNRTFDVLPTREQSQLDTILLSVSNVPAELRPKEAR